MARNNNVNPPTMLLDEDKEKTYVLHTPRDLDPLLERIGDACRVLLGEASHGTHEYYIWRTEISKRLIQEKALAKPEQLHGEQEYRIICENGPGLFISNRYGGWRILNNHYVNSELLERIGLAIEE